ncbi:MAG: helix-turn-helix transcriptional regulator [Vulcanimicrobiaceae bacterium]
MLASVAPAQWLPAERREQLDFSYDQALVAWMEGSVDGASAALRGVDCSGDPTSEGRVKILRSWILALERRYADQSKLLADGIRTCLAAGTPDIGIIARAVHALSALAREMDIPQAFSLASSLCKDLPWTNDLRYERLQTLRNVGWTNALRANYISGIRQLDAAKRFAFTPYLLLLSTLDHTSIAGISGQQVVYEAGIQEAAEMMDGLNDATSGEEMMALIVAAEVFSDVDATRSVAALRWFDRIRGDMSASFVLSKDPQNQAMHAYASARIAQRAGQRRKACAQAEAAFAIFDDMHFEWRAARCALLMHRCGAGGKWLQVAREKIARYQRSFVAEEVRELLKPGKVDGVLQLTQRQAQVLTLLVEGLTVDEVAGRLKASPNTVKVHKNRIYVALGVRNRAELVRKATAL